MRIETRERAIYLTAFLLLAVNRVLARQPEAFFPSVIIENPDHPVWLGMQVFMIAAIGYSVYATWRFFRFAGFAQHIAIINGVFAPLFWPLIMLPQAIIVYRRLRKKRLAATQSTTSDTPPEVSPP